MGGGEAEKRCDISVIEHHDELLIIVVDDIATAPQHQPSVFNTAARHDPDEAALAVQATEELVKLWIHRIGGIVFAFHGNIGRMVMVNVH